MVDCPKFSSPEVYAVIAKAERETALADEAARELARARKKHPAMNTAHEGYAVILEELDELWEEVRAQKQDHEKMRKEAIQIAAMALRFVADICDVKPEVRG